MKICIIANANSAHTARWLKPLIARGDDVYLISYLPALHHPPGLRELVDLTHWPSMPKLRWLLWGLRIRKILRSIEPDILHAHQIQAAGWLGYLANFHPFVVSSWGSDLLVEPDRSSLRRFLVVRVLSQCDRITVPSPLLRQAAIDLGVPAEKIRHIPWGIDTNIFTGTPNDKFHTRQQLGLYPDTRVILCPRGISQIYNIDIVIHAFKQLLNKDTNILLLLLRFNVEPAYFANIQTLIQDERLDQYVRWLPAQNSPEDMAHLYRASDLVISIPQSEGYGASILEAMACGTPTVVSDLPIFKEELVHGVHTLKVPTNNVTEICTALYRLLTEGDIRNNLIQNGLQLAQSRSIRAQFAATDRLYRELLE